MFALSSPPNHIPLKSRGSIKKISHFRPINLKRHHAGKYLTHFRKAQCTWCCQIFDPNRVGPFTQNLCLWGKKLWFIWIATVIEVDVRCRCPNDQMQSQINFLALLV